MSVVVCLHLIWGGEEDGKESEDDDERGDGRKDKREGEREKKGKGKDVTRRVLNHYPSTKENGLRKMGKSEKSSRQISPPLSFQEGNGEHTVPTISEQGCLSPAAGSVMVWCHHPVW